MINFFRSEEALRQWRETNPDTDGAGATMADSFELGRRAFGGLL